MGANGILPIVPTFTAGSPAISDLQALSYAASFLIDNGTRPTWKFIQASTTGTLATNTWTVVPFSTGTPNIAYDSDGVWSSSNNGAVINTMGYYNVEAAVQLVSSSTKINFICAFKWTAGPNSPFSASSPYWFGYHGNDTPISSVGEGSCALCIRDITPFVMYPGDILQVMTQAGAAISLEINDNSGQPTNYMQGRVNILFTGHWSALTAALLQDSLLDETSAPIQDELGGDLA